MFLSERFGKSWRIEGSIKKRSMTSLNSSSSFPLTAHVRHQYKVRALPNLRSPTASPPTVTEPLLLFSSLLSLSGLEFVDFSLSEFTW